MGLSLVKFDKRDFEDLFGIEMVWNVGKKQMQIRQKNIDTM